MAQVRSGRLITNFNSREDYEEQKVTLWELIEGTWPSGDDVAMERGYGALHNVAIGDTIETRINERVRKVKIVGILNNREINPHFSPDLALYTHERQKVTPNTGVTGYFLCCS